MKRTRAHLPLICLVLWNTVLGDWIGVCSSIILHTCLAIILNLLGYAAGQLTVPPPTCPGDTFTFRCTVTGNRSGITIWRVGGGDSECILPHSTAGTTSNCGPADNTFTARGVTGFGTNATSFSSTLSSTATSTLDCTVVECFGPALPRDAENRVGNSILQISGQYYAALHTYYVDIFSSHSSWAVTWRFDYCMYVMSFYYGGKAIGLLYPLVLTV